MIQLPPQVDRPARAEILTPLCGVLLDAVETLHEMEGSEWAQETMTAEERGKTFLAVRAVVQMMLAYGLPIEVR